MSWQQVNLYLVELQPSKELLTFNRALGVAALMLVLVTGLSVMTVFEVGHLKTQVESKRVALERDQQEMTQLLALLPRSQAAQVQAELDELRAELARRERIYFLINQQDMGNSDGFAKQFYALARQHQPALSLAGFSLQQGGQKIDMVGEAYAAEAVPQYIQRLQYEPAFERSVFGRLIIERQSDGRVSFALRHSDQLSAAGGRNGDR